jgi:hypothetical protein
VNIESDDERAALGADARARGPVIHDLIRLAPLFALCGVVVAFAYTAGLFARTKGEWASAMTIADLVNVTARNAPVGLSVALFVLIMMSLFSEAHLRFSRVVLSPAVAANYRRRHIFAVLSAMSMGGAMLLSLVATNAPSVSKPLVLASLFVLLISFTITYSFVNVIRSDEFKLIYMCSIIGLMIVFLFYAFGAVRAMVTVERGTLTAIVSTNGEVHCGRLILMGQRGVIVSDLLTNSATLTTWAQISKVQQGVGCKEAPANEPRKASTKAG